MAKSFYGNFDEKCLADATNRERTKDYRSAFHQDRDRVMFSPAFRRLQAKTQVFQAGEYDFYRTRLTHSMEVAGIAKSIAAWLATKYSNVRLDPDLLEAICLAHDIGHPPFGHAGERALQELMKNHGGFEGNAQTLRILTRTIYSRPKGRGGMSPTRALLDGVLKYKRLYRDRGKDHHHFIYDEEKNVLEFCFGTRDLAGKLGGTDVNEFKSLECQVMDLADDIAYSCFDLVDGVKARFISVERMDGWSNARNRKVEAQKHGYLEALEDGSLGKLRTIVAENNLQRDMSIMIGKLIEVSSVKSAHNFMTPRTRRHAYQLEIPPRTKARIELQKALTRDLVFRSSALQQIEYKGGHVLHQLGDALFGNYLKNDGKIRLVPDSLHWVVLGTKIPSARARLLCDHLSGMTDAYALRSYKRLFDPDYGSISELI